MNEYKFKQIDFENSSILFIVEDMLKNFITGKFIR